MLHILIFIRILRWQAERHRNRWELTTNFRVVCAYFWSVQHRHRHQSILPSISRVIPRVTSHTELVRPLRKIGHFFNLDPIRPTSTKNRYTVCAPLYRMITSKLFKSSVRISHCSVSDSSKKIVIHTVQWLRNSWHAEHSSSWPCSHPEATGCHYTDTATIFQTSQEAVTTRHLAGTHNLFG